MSTTPATAGRSRGRRETLLAGGLLGVLYVLLRQRTWSLDGAIHTLASTHATDPLGSGHLLLRPVAWAWTSLLSLGGPLTFARRYDALEILFGLFGVVALTLLFSVVRRRAGAWPAWLALAGVSMMRCSERQITALDEKPLGMLLFAIAVFVTDRVTSRLMLAGREPGVRDVVPMALVWAFAVAGHLQDAPFAVACALALPAFFRGPGRFARAARVLSSLALIAASAFLAVVILIHAGAGGWAAVPALADQLFHHRFAPPPAPSLVALARSTVLGWIKAFFLVDRLSPRWGLGAAVTGFALLAGTIAWGLRRRPDPLAVALAVGSLGLMLLVPAANYFPDFGDSYTMIVFALFVPLAAAPPAAIAAATAAVLLVNVPAALAYSFPETTIQAELAGMVARQRETRLPWVLLEELTPFELEQGLAPVYYAMSESLRVERASMNALPRSGFLLELPEPIERDGRLRPGRVETMRLRLAKQGRRTEAARLVDPPRRVRSDFRAYGDYLLVAPAD